MIPAEIIERRILMLRGHKVMLDFHLAELYGAETKILKRAVRRNQERFPKDFMFELTKDEWDNLRFHFGTSKRGGIRYIPMAFTEQGVAMLSSVLRSKQAINVNVEIMRTFVKIREMLSSHKDLTRKLDKLEKKYDSQFKAVFDALRQLMQPEAKPNKTIGFRVEEKKESYKSRHTLQRKQKF